VRPRKRWRQERDAALGLATGAGLGSLLGFFGARRDAVSCRWLWGAQDTWHKVRESPGA